MTNPDLPGAALTPFAVPGTMSPPAGPLGEVAPAGGGRVTLGLFGGPGGWAEAMRSLGISEAGIELDAAACATRRAAGHTTVRADVAAFPVRQLAGRVRGFAASPPCITFSAAGSQAGNIITGELAILIRDLSAGRPTRGARCKAMARTLRASPWLGDQPTPQPDTASDRWRKAQQAWKGRLLARQGSRAKLRRAMTDAPPGPHLTREQRSARIWGAVRSAALVAEPARYIHACRPEWIALEQVPAVLPLWRTYAAEFRKAGYSVWCGLLNAADYGVPQTRIRAILIASLARKVTCPEPTHYDPRKGMQLWGSPWVSMAEALGMGATRRPAPTVTAGGTATGGAEPFGHRDRDALKAEQDAGRWALRMDAQERASVRDVTAPAPAPALKFGHSAAECQWVLRTSFGEPAAGPKSAGSGSHGSHEMNPVTQPSHTVTSKAKDWKLRNNNNNNNACERSLDEPAGTLFFGHRSNWAGWVQERPATTVLGDPRIGRPGHKGREAGGESHYAVDSVRITVQEAAVLQSFRPDYPWQGSKTKQFEAVGNAIPPLLAEHIIAMAAGIQRSEVAA